MRGESTPWTSLDLFTLLFFFSVSSDRRVRSRIRRVRSRITLGVPDGRDWTRERHPRAASACAREEIRDHWEDREGGETGARHSLLARQHSDLSIDFHDRSRTVRERTNPTNERTWNERRERYAAPKDLRGAPRISNRAARAIYVPQGCLKETPESRGRDVRRHAKMSAALSTLVYASTFPTLAVLEVYSRQTRRGFEE